MMIDYSMYLAEFRNHGYTVPLKPIRIWIIIVEEWNMPVKDWYVLFQYLQSSLFHDKPIHIRRNWIEAVEKFVIHSIALHNTRKENLKEKLEEI